MWKVQIGITSQETLSGGDNDSIRNGGNSR